jgi:hypothetical protein
MIVHKRRTKLPKSAALMYGLCHVVLWSDAASAEQSSRLTEVSTPGHQSPVALASKSTQSTAPIATWVGFRQTGPKTALVYVNLTQVVAVSSAKQDKTITFTLRKTRIQVRNNQNPLLATHFDSMVESVRLVPSGKDVNLVIQLKREATMSSKVEQETQGAVLYVELSEP